MNKNDEETPTMRREDRQILWAAFIVLVVLGFIGLVLMMHTPHAWCGIARTC